MRFELIGSLLPQLAADRIEIGRTVVATGARVALGDEIGAILGAQMIVMLIGERPGLSASDSLGAYLTYAPRIGRTDAERNCVSNIHGAGLGYDEAAFRIAWLIREGLARQRDRRRAEGRKRRANRRGTSPRIQPDAANPRP